MAFNINKIRSDFPFLNQKVYGKPLVYLDNAATTQKPQTVIDRISDYYTHENCNIHRGFHFLSQQTTAAFEGAREYIARFINAKNKEEVIFTKGTTESINLVATSFGRAVLGKGDEVLVSAMEHHSNLVPWQNVCKEKSATLRIIPFDENGELEVDIYRKLITARTKIIALAHISNALGTINPIKEMIAIAHEKGIPVLIDGAQAVAHLKVDVTDLDCDFYCFSGHKAYGPMGAGVLYGMKNILEFMDPYQFGGEMVDQVCFAGTTFNDIPYKFEAGTPNVEAVLGMESALKYIEATGHSNIADYEDQLLEYGTEKLLSIDGVKFYGKASKKSGIFSFLIGDIHPYDAGTIIDKYGIAVRTGHHCAQPVMDRYDIPGTIRASLALYNTKEEIDKLVEAIRQVKKMFE